MPLSYCQSSAPPCGCSSVRVGALHGGLPAAASPLGSLYKGITIIRCLINPYRVSAICLGRVTRPFRFTGCRRSGAREEDGRQPPPSSIAARDPRYNSLRCNLLAELIGLRNWNLPNPRQRRWIFKVCLTQLPRSDSAAKRRTRNHPLIDSPRPVKRRDPNLQRD